MEAKASVLARASTLLLYPFNRTAAQSLGVCLALGVAFGTGTDGFGVQGGERVKEHLLPQMLALVRIALA